MHLIHIYITRKVMEYLGCTMETLVYDRWFSGNGLALTTNKYCCFNSLRPRQNGRHFADDIFKCIFLNEIYVWIMSECPIKISLKFVPKGPINNMPASVQITAWRRPGDKPLSEPMMVSLLTHICVTRPQWVNATFTCIVMGGNAICNVRKWKCIIDCAGMSHFLYFA